jgi:hypothetical protein
MGLDAGRSLVLVHPTTVQLHSIRPYLEAGLAHRIWHRAKLAELVARPGTLAQRLLDYLGSAETAEDGDMRSLVDQLRGTVLWLEPTQRIAEGSEMTRFLLEFTRLSASVTSHERPLLVCVCSSRALDPVPTSDAALLSAYWWGRVGPLDTLVAVDEILEGQRVVGDREIIAEVAGWDLALAETLAEAWGARPDIDALLSRLPSIAPVRDEMVVHQASLASATDMTADPPNELFDAWADGVVNWWGERTVVHVGQYRAMGDQGAIERRIWRAQVSAALPYVEIVRERLARWMVDRPQLIDAKWRFKNIASLEVGAIEKVFLDSSGLRRSSQHRELARLLRQIRHKLAHLEHVDRELLARVESLMKSGLFT